MRLVADLDKLDVDAHAIGVAEHASFQGVLDIQSVANFSDGLPGQSIGGSGSNHTESQGVEATEARNHFVGQTGAVIILLRVAAQIGEWYHYETDSFLQERARSDPMICSISDDENRCRGSQHHGYPLKPKRMRRNLNTGCRAIVPTNGNGRL